MKNVFKILIILIIILILLFAINLIRNYLIIDKIYSAKENLGTISSYYYKHVDNNIIQIEEIYENENYYLKSTTYDNKTHKTLLDKKNNTLTMLSKEGKSTTEDASSYIIGTPYYNVFFIDSSNQKSDLIKTYLLKPIKTEDNFYILKENNSETIWYINKNTLHIEKYILDGKTSYYTVDFSEVNDDVFNIDFNKIVETNNNK